MTPEQKIARIARAEKHAKLDRLISGSYVDGSQGCSVGCDALDIHGRDPGGGYHSIVAGHDGTPEWLEHLRDTIFEGLPDDKRAWWHVELAKALPTDRDWQPYYHLVSIAILDLALEQRETWAEPYKSEVIAAIEGVKALHAAESAAWSAARSAAWSAAWSAARSAAESAAESAWSAARSAAWSAARSAAWSAAESAAYVKLATSVLEILRAPS